MIGKREQYASVILGGGPGGYSTLAQGLRAMLADPWRANWRGPAQSSWQPAADPDPAEHRLEIVRSILVSHSAADMYQLVLDVAAYPEFLSWCADGEVLEQTDTTQIARLDVSIGGLRQSFTTENRLRTDEELSLSLVEGPFKRLSGSWQFSPLGTTGCKVTLSLQFEFSNSLLSSAFQRGFAHIAEKLIYDFSSRAKDVYGEGHGHGRE